MKCSICGCEFVPIIKQHYISRDNDQTGIATAFSKVEKRIYDTFDCPECGCQIVAQERKRAFVQAVSVGHPDEVVFVEKETEEKPECFGNDMVPQTECPCSLSYECDKILKEKHENEGKK